MQRNISPGYSVFLSTLLNETISHPLSSLLEFIRDFSFSFVSSWHLWFFFFFFPVSIKSSLSSFEVWDFHLILHTCTPQYNLLSIQAFLSSSGTFSFYEVTNINIFRSQVSSVNIYVVTIIKRKWWGLWQGYSAHPT